LNCCFTLIAQIFLLTLSSIFYLFKKNNNVKMQDKGQEKTKTEKKIEKIIKKSEYTDFKEIEGS